MKNLVFIFLFGSGMLFGGQMEMSSSQFTWKAEKIVGAKHSGPIFLESYKIEMTDGHLESGEFVMNMNSFNVTDLKGVWRYKFLKHMKSDQFFDVKKYPFAKLIISRVSDGQAFGLLTIKNETHPVQFPISQEGNVFKGNMVFDRTQYKIVYGSENFFTNLGDKVIRDEVQLEFEVTLQPKAQAS